MLLSLLIISHNNKEKLRRCIDSILSQELPFEYEIIISDDASNDGSYELAQEYAKRYSFIHTYTCDTNTMNPSNNSSRSGYNRCNAYQYAKGKYIAHIDGDDFLIDNSKIYQKQVELLEKHQGCSCCMANDYTLIEGEDIENKKIRHPQLFGSGNILTSVEYLQNHFRESPCFVYRRYSQFNPKELLGGYYVDNTITAFYLQFGDIVCLDDAGYVYVQYSKSIWNGYSNNDKQILGCPALFNAFLFPKWKSVYWQSPHYLGKIKEIVEMAMHGERVTEETKKWMNGMDSYLYQTFNRDLTIYDKSRLELLHFLLGVMRRTKRKHPAWPQLWKLLDILL